MTQYDPKAPLSRKLRRVKKLLVSLVGTGLTLGVWLLGEPHSTPELLAAVLAFIGTNAGVYEAKNLK